MSKRCLTGTINRMIGPPPAAGAPFLSDAHRQAEGLRTNGGHFRPDRHAELVQQAPSGGDVPRSGSTTAWYGCRWRRLAVTLLGAAANTRPQRPRRLRLS